MSLRGISLAKIKFMNLIEFLKQFPDEQACINNFRRMKERDLVVCEQCGGIVHYWLANKLKHECKGCKRRVSLRSDTTFEHTKLPFQYWYLSIHLMTATKKGLSVLELQRKIGHKTYEPVFRVMHKIRSAMGKRDDQYLLKDMIELDDAYFETCTEKREMANLKRGKGSQRQTKTTVIAETIVLEKAAGGAKSSQCRYFKMKVNPSEAAEHSQELVGHHVAKNAVLFSDNSKACVTLHKIVEAHLIENSVDSIVNHSLKWVHIAISNAKRNLLGIFHSVNEGYLQNYLNKFCYRLN